MSVSQILSCSCSVMHATRTWTDRHLVPAGWCQCNHTSVSGTHVSLSTRQRARAIWEHMWLQCDVPLGMCSWRGSLAPCLLLALAVFTVQPLGAILLLAGWGLRASSNKRMFPCRITYCGHFIPAVCSGRGLCAAFGCVLAHYLRGVLCLALLVVVGGRRCFCKELHSQLCEGAVGLPALALTHTIATQHCSR